MPNWNLTGPLFQVLKMQANNRLTMVFFVYRHRHFEYVARKSQISCNIRTEPTLNTTRTAWSHPMKISILESIHTTNIGQICRHNKWKIGFEYYNDLDHSNRFLIHCSSEIRCVLAFPSICRRWLICYTLAKLMLFHWNSSFWIDRKNRNRYEFNEAYANNNIVYNGILIMFWCCFWATNHLFWILS